MKKFLSTFAVCLVLVESFIFFGGWQLFDFNRYWYLAGGSVALLLAIFASVWERQDQRLSALEEQIKELENQKEKQQ